MTAVSAKTQSNSALVRPVFLASNLDAQGVVLSGDWDDALGSAVNAGDVLFEIGRNQQYKWMLDLSEFDIDSIRPGQKIGIRMPAAPAVLWQATVSRITPVAMAVDGRSSIKVHGKLQGGESSLRPGMAGIGKVLVGDNSRAVQWFRGLRTHAIWLGWKLGFVS